jgi:precorrin-2/cobalt-factor-2 C20-methyltransferase
MTGTLYGVGIGPGDPELMTLKAVRIIRDCSVIVVPKSGDGERVALNIAAQAVPELGDKQLVELDMPMTRDPERLRTSHKAAADTIAGFLADGLDVAFITLGDPTIYSTYIYVHRLVGDRGIRQRSSQAFHPSAPYRQSWTIASLRRPSRCISYRDLTAHWMNHWH